MAIAAISTPRGTGGIAVVRLSGGDALEIAGRVWQGKRLADAKSHTAHLGKVQTIGGEPIDECVATLFKGPNSYTGFDTVEFSLHGSPWIQQAVMRALVEAGATPAGPGEFTRQAFLNGRLDLAQAEGVADLMAASSKAAARVALTQVAGGISKKLNTLREKLMNLASLLELELDFSEEDVEFADRRQLAEGVAEIKEEVERLADSYLRGKVYKEGISIALAGVPNAGKSSLLNRLVEEDKALVTDIAGTTRDVIEATAEIGGVLCRFYDTAGLRQTSDVVEGMGIERARERIKSAAMVLWLVDPTQDAEMQQAEYKATVGDRYTGDRVVVYTKSDIAAENNNSNPNCDSDQLGACKTVSVSAKSGAGIDQKNYDFGQSGECKTVSVSAKSGAGIEELKSIIAGYGGTATGEGDRFQETLITNLRHYEELQTALPYLQRLEEGITTLPTDLLAEELRGALTHIGAITGAITTPDLLKNIFANFCIGK